MKVPRAYKLLPLLLAPFLVISALHAQWFVNGIAISISGGDQRSPKVVSDTQLGAIVIWAVVFYLSRLLTREHIVLSSRGG